MARSEPLIKRHASVCLNGDRDWYGAGGLTDFTEGRLAHHSTNRLLHEAASMTKLSILKQASERIKAIRHSYAQQRFFSQGTVRIRCGDFEIEAPEKHLLVDILSKQPHRDSGLVLAAKCVSAKYPRGAFVDIGANIGDTAAIMATHAHNKLILVEASDYFFDFLSRNARRLPNEVLLLKTLISDGAPVTGVLHHWAGTASISARAGETVNTPSKHLSEIADDSTRLVKIDTDGFDFKILSSSVEWLRAVRPAVLFEDQIRNAIDLQEANRTFSQLAEIGYRSFVVWDDPGVHVLSTTSLEVIHDLNRYLFRIWQGSGRKSIYNYDVLCLHEHDADIYDSILEQCRGFDAKLDADACAD